jgi:hypothetical protein
VRAGPGTDERGDKGSGRGRRREPGSSKQGGASGEGRMAPPALIRARRAGASIGSDANWSSSHPPLCVGCTPLHFNVMSIARSSAIESHSAPTPFRLVYPPSGYTVWPVCHSWPVCRVPTQLGRHARPAHAGLQPPRWAAAARPGPALSSAAARPGKGFSTGRTWGRLWCARWPLD